jgi:hypothetical protein
LPTARRLLKEILLDQREVFEKKRPGTTRDVLEAVGDREDITIGGRSIKVRPLGEWLCGFDD